MESTTTGKVQIKSRWCRSVIYETEALADTTQEDTQMLVALEAAVASRADLYGADLYGADLCEAYLQGANLYWASLGNTDLRAANLRDAELSDVDLGIANLSEADLCEANLRGANLRGADLSDANLCEANLPGANLRGANLRGANLCDANLSGADLCRADLSGANLTGASLRGANLCGATLRGGLELVGERPVLCIGPIGSAGRTILAWITDKGLRLEAGCFFGTREEFVEQLAIKHADNLHGQEYTAALVLIDAHVRLWTPGMAG